MSAFRRCGILQGYLSVEELDHQTFFVANKPSELEPMAPIPNFVEINDISWDENHVEINKDNFDKMKDHIHKMQNYVTVSAYGKGALQPSATNIEGSNALDETGEKDTTTSRKRPLKLSGVHGTMNVQQLHLQQTVVVEGEQHKNMLKTMTNESKAAAKLLKDSEFNKLEEDFFRCFKICECGKGELCVGKRMKRCPTCKDIKPTVCRKKICKEHAQIAQVSPVGVSSQQQPRQQQTQKQQQKLSTIAMDPSSPITFPQIGHNGEGFDKTNSMSLTESLSKRLTTEQRNMVRYSLVKIRNGTNVLNLKLWRLQVTRGTMRNAYLTDHSLLRLDSQTTDDPGEKWLNDDLIDFAGEILNERERAKRNTVMGYANKVVLTCQLAKILYTSYYEENNDYYAIRDRIIRRWSSFDASNQDLILCPVNISNSHWILMCIAPKLRTLMTIDSFGRDYSMFKEPFLKWLELHYSAHGKDFQHESWQYLAQQGPRQTNGYDCGVFVLTSSLFILDNLALSFTQDHMDSWRDKWVHSILNLTIKSSFKYDKDRIVVDLESSQVSDSQQIDSEDAIDSAVDIAGPND